ncbi:MAG TPA: NADH-quinone oxidoreductase subunit N [Anaerolineae bacterium]|nr:NADH-quinone oxidoreductase subunit N [Anaerolineae bacterium]HOQ98391.1 NADH-quinone oxidoreductase subunit N [Anaerolineae bacterium]HPL26497.1 NADH-quinone oxidoreductase subunit N [Anaerolineae bacterium]
MENTSLNIASTLSQLIVAATGMLVMLADAIVRRGNKAWLGWLALLGLVAALAWTALRGLGAPAFDGMLAADGLSAGFALLLLGAAALSVLLSMDYLRREGLEPGPYYALILFATTGALIMAAAADLIAVFIGLEVLSISLYVLAAYAKGEAASREAGLKYLLLGAFASAFLLYGIALLYGATGSTRLVAMGQALRQAGAAADPLLWGGVALLAVGLGFKLALVPFHGWAPDVYQGAPTSVTAYMSVVSKAGAFAALVRLALVVLGPVQPLVSTLLAILAVLTVTVGNIVALVQDDVKRLLAYSSIAQAGYVLVAVVAGSQLGAAAVLFYLAGYVFTNLGAFAVVVAWQKKGEAGMPSANLAGLGFRRPWLAAGLTLCLLSLSGIPLTAGFVGKFYLFGAAVEAGWVWLAIVAVLNSVVSAFYYLHLVVLMYMREPAAEPEGRPGWPLGVALTLCVAGVLVLGVMPGPALDWARQALALVL